MITSSVCKHIKKSGDRCKAWTVTGSHFCFFHDPYRKRERASAQKRGGVNKQKKNLPLSTPNLTIKSANDVVNLLATTINQIRRGELDTKIATSIGYLSSTLLRAREQGELEERLTNIEQQFMHKSESNRCHSSIDYKESKNHLSN